MMVATVIGCVDSVIPNHSCCCGTFHIIVSLHVQSLLTNIVGCQVGSYHASSLLVAARAPTPGVVSRAIGLEGLTSFLAGLWGIGTGASTLTENVHTIAVTKMGSRRAVEIGACLLVIMSLFGKCDVSGHGLKKLMSLNVLYKLKNDVTLQVRLELLLHQYLQ